jgi:hypothetical protein
MLLACTCVVCERARSLGCAQVGAREWLPMGRRNLHPSSLWWSFGRAAVGPRERLRLERERHVLRGSLQWESGGPEVGAREWLSLGHERLRRCRWFWASGGAAVGARERLPMGRPSLRTPAWVRLVVIVRIGIWNCGSANGMPVPRVTPTCSPRLSRGRKYSAASKSIFPTTC